jgi:hypothetical protein
VSLITRQTESGLVLVEQTRDEAGLRRALKQIDPQLRLLRPEIVFPGTATGYWRVVCQWSYDQPAEPVLTWMDANRNPMELTARILDEVNRHQKGGRGYGKTSDERNAEIAASAKRDRSEVREAIEHEYRPFLDRGRTGVSMGAHNKIPYWMRRNRGGYKDDQ